MATIARRRTHLADIYAAAVAAAHPSTCLPPHLPPPPARGKVVMLAAGKAAGSMTAVAEAHYRDSFGLKADGLAGLAVTRRGHGEPTRLIPLVEVGHPVPDADGVVATERTLALAAAAGADDLVLVLLSGGGSANWIAPAGKLTLEEKQTITRALLRSGAAIREFNTVRKRLSRIKGGRLAAVAAPARLLTLAISDVPGDDPSTIASGPTVPDPTTTEEARVILGRRNILLPPAALDLMGDPANETPKAGHPAFERAEFRIVARPADAIAAAAAAARRAGYEPLVLGADIEGEARAIARQHACLALELRDGGRRAAIVSGGELTVTVRGQGRGGPNQEYALALALALKGAPGVTALAADTDGYDGGGGAASDPAGAFVDETTLARAAALGLDGAAFLADNDATGFFEPLGDLLTLGPTRTNVNDCRVVLVEGR